jgi:hypothetical protein
MCHSERSEESAFAFVFAFVFAFAFVFVFVFVFVLKGHDFSRASIIDKMILGL